MATDTRIAAIFTFTHILSYTDWRGRERECEATIRYRYDGADCECLSAVAHSDDDEAAYELDAIADELIEDRCGQDYAEWLADLDDELVIACAAESTVPGVAA